MKCLSGKIDGLEVASSHDSGTTFARPLFTVPSSSGAVSVAALLLRLPKNDRLTDCALEGQDMQPAWEMHASDDCPA